jgi:hypothetical protein
MKKHIYFLALTISIRLVRSLAIHQGRNSSVARFEKGFICAGDAHFNGRSAGSWMN